MESKVVTFLNKQRKNGQFCDVLMQLQSGFSVYGHFCVIAAQSDFVGGEHFLQESLQFSLHNPLKINIRNFSCNECLEKIIEFFYNDIVSITKEHEEHFKKLAKILSVTELIRIFRIEDGIEETHKQNDINVEIENVFEEKQNHYKVRNPRTVKSTHSKINYCFGCIFKCYKVNEMIEHMKNCKKQSLTCCLCDFGFFSSKDFMEHIQKHEDTKPFFCNKCDARFGTKAALHIHEPKHSLETPFKCEHCSKAFKWKHGLSNHLVIHNSEKRMLCDVCGYCTSHIRALKAHKLTHTGQMFKCSHPGCAHKTSRKENLKIHVATHANERPFVCEVCGYKFSQSKNLKRHALKHTENAKTLKCQLCSFSSLRSDKLKEHVDRVHIEKPIQLELTEKVESSFDLVNIAFPDDKDDCNTNLKSISNNEPLNQKKRKKINKASIRTHDTKKLKLILPKPSNSSNCNNLSSALESIQIPKMNDIFLIPNINEEVVISQVELFNN